MNRLRTIGLLVLVVLNVMACTQKLKNTKATTDKPINILWLFGEDISPWMPAYGDHTVETPNIDFLADNGILFTNCFSMSPVCSPTRSGLITGVMPTTIGAHNHRSGRSKKVVTELPDHIEVLPQIFKKHAYHVFNEGKDDFNWQYDWDDYWQGSYEEGKGFGVFGHGSWKDKKEGQPYFGVIELFGGKSKKKPKSPVNPSVIKVPDYYPDIPSVRNDIANHYNQIQTSDEEIGLIIEELKKSDAYANTIIVFMSDNGYKTLRDKQFLYDGGTHMPLIISSPGNPNLLKERGVRDDMVSLLDVTATTLQLGNIDIPAYMESMDLFANNYHREYVISARDRCDFTIDRIRSVRSKEYKYIRNYMTDRPLMQAQYRDNRKSYKDLIAAFESGTPTFADEWLSDKRPSEELYDLIKDPQEIHNLASDQKYKIQLETMRKFLNDWVIETDDKGQYPESKEALALVLERWGERCVNPEYDVIKSK